MEKIFKFGALAMFLGTAGVAHADLATTTGGVTVKTDDGRFEAKFGGRIHLDTNTPIDDDQENEENGVAEQGFDAFFRRARLTLEGKAYGWSYKFENDFAGQSGTQGSGFREMWIGTKVMGANLRLGNAKPYRSMEELTSSNEIFFMERPFSSASGLFASRQFQLGAFLDGAGSNWGWGTSVHNLKSAAADSSDNDGVGFSARGYFAPVMTDATVVHLGLAAGIDNPTEGLTVNSNGIRYAGRSSPGESLSAATADEQTTYGFELAGKSGPFYAQAEYAISEHAQEAGDDIDVDTYYVQLGWLITGETKPYDVKKGVFKSPKPANPYGAWEAKLRYDYIENDGVDLEDEREISQLGIGLNWFVNPAVRIMFEYLIGEAEYGAPTEDGLDKEELDVFATRIQFAF
jgi:phosphate-selective porin OprO and OprP